jgi:phage replication O-like protein O
VADVQTEHGHVRVANALWEAWTRASLTGTERAVLMHIARQSYGWARHTTEEWCSLSRLVKATGANRSGVSKALQGLRMKRIIERVTHGNGGPSPAATVWRPVKDWESWSPGVLPDDWRPIGAAPGTKMGPGTETGPGTKMGPPPGTEMGPLKNKGEEPKGLVEEERAHEAGDTTPILDGMSSTGAVRDAIAADCGVLSMNGTPKQLDRIAAWVEANGGRAGAVYREKLAHVRDRAYRTGHDRLNHFMRLWSDDGTPKPSPGSASTTPAVAGEPIRRTAAEERQWQAFLVGEAARARGDEII